MTMTAFANLVLAAALVSDYANAFSPASYLAVRTHIHTRSTFLCSVKLKPKPTGGEELTKLSSSMEGSRMENLGADDEQDAFKFWSSTTADGEKVKKLRA